MSWWKLCCCLMVFPEHFEQEQMPGRPRQPHLLSVLRSYPWEYSETNDWLCSIATHPAGFGSSSPWEPVCVTRNTLKFKEISVVFFTTTRGSVTTTHHSVCPPSLFSVPDPQALHQLGIHPLEELHKSKLHLHKRAPPAPCLPCPCFLNDLLHLVSPSSCASCSTISQLFQYFLWLHAELWFLLLPPRVTGLCILFKVYYLSN